MVGKRRKENVEMANLAKKDANGIRTEAELRRPKNATNAVSLFTVSTRVAFLNQKPLHSLNISVFSDAILILNQAEDSNVPLLYSIGGN